MHEALEAELAEFKGTPAVLTFQSGFTANTGRHPDDHRRDRPHRQRRLNHASIIDGMRLSKAPRKVYPHADVDGAAGRSCATRSSTAATAAASRTA